MTTLTKCVLFELTNMKHTKWPQGTADTDVWSPLPRCVRQGHHDEPDMVRVSDPRLMQSHISSDPPPPPSPFRRAPCQHMHQQAAARWRDLPCHGARPTSAAPAPIEGRHLNYFEWDAWFKTGARTAGAPAKPHVAGPASW